MVKATKTKTEEQMDDSSCCCYQLIKTNSRQIENMETSLTKTPVTSGFYKFLARFSGVYNIFICFCEEFSKPFVFLCAFRTIETFFSPINW